MGLKLESVFLKVGGEVFLDDINLTVERNTTYVLLGRTLSGKTSLLRLLAGLDRPTSGRILLDGKDVTGWSVRKRSVAMVYQQFINYPSLTVYQNIASPLKVRGFPRQEVDQRVRRMAAMLHIEDLLDRLPAELSGGQQQRTAIARSLIKDADLLLLDEPLVNLDYKLREELRFELREIFKQRQAMVVYTTTEPAEALMLGGKIVVLDEGRILQTGPTPEVFRNPANLKVAEVFSDPPINFLKAIVKENQVYLGEGIRFPLSDHLRSLSPGSYTFAVRSHHLFLRPVGPDDITLLTRVELAEINGSETFIHVNFEGARLVVQESGVFPHRIGSELRVFVNPACFFAFDDQGRLAASPFYFRP